MNFVFDDGGRSAAGFKGTCQDCVTRSVAIATGCPYAEIYAELASGTGKERISGSRSARNGIHTKRQWFKDYMTTHGFKWVPTMAVGSGCKVHLRDGELPMGRLIVAVSRHYTAVIDGIVRDTFDPSRDGNRCVYGYWIKI